MNTMNLFQERKAAIIIAMLFLFVSPVWAQEVELNEEQKAQIALTKERLELTEDQAEAVEAILSNSVVERLIVLDKYGINPGDPDFQRPKMSTMRKMRDDMDRIDSDVEKQLKNHLTKDQMKTWKKLEKDRKNRMRSQMRNGN